VYVDNIGLQSSRHGGGLVVKAEGSTVGMVTGFIDRRKRKVKRNQSSEQGYIGGGGWLEGRFLREWKIWRWSGNSGRSQSIWGEVHAWLPLTEIQIKGRLN